MTRIYQPIELVCGSKIALDTKASHHIASVLRARAGDPVTIFNGQGGEYSSTIVQIHKKQVMIQIEEFILREAESPLKICLAQGISRNDKMDTVIQKAVELGVQKIIPVLTERCTVKLNEERRVKRFQHWQSIMIGACEQSGRNQLPELFMPTTLENSLQDEQADRRFVLSPTASGQLKEQRIQPNQKIIVLIGPEGGLSSKEINDVCQRGFIPLNLGPRILRTETAAIAAITALQSHFGDMG